MASPATAFDRVAARYEQGFGRNPVGRVFRYVVQERLLRAFPKGARVLDLGCGTGEDASFLVARGRRVVGVDASPRMIEQARERAAGQAGLRFEVACIEDLGVLGGGFDGAYSNFGALNCADLKAVGRELARALRPKAPLLLSVMGPRPLPLLLERLLAGRGERRGERDPSVGGLPVATRYPTPERVRRELGPEFGWSGGLALGVLLPGPEHAAWAARHPQAFALLAAGEGVVRGWPLVRSLGDHNLLEGYRR
jgi:SAM-dependent methyltransferase